eukprot:356298-Chlamydomonas_euryale.AAC.4
MTEVHGGWSWEREVGRERGWKESGGSVDTGPNEPSAGHGKVRGGGKRVKGKWKECELGTNEPLARDGKGRGGKENEHEDQRTVSQP